MSIKLMDLAWESDLPTGRKFVLVALCDFASDDGVAWPCVETIARKCSMGERTVQQHLADLAKDGLISRRDRKGHSSLYYVHGRQFPMLPPKVTRTAHSAPPTDPSDCKPPQISHPREIRTPADSAPKPPQILHETPADFAPRTVIEPSVEPSLLAGKPAGGDPEGFADAWRAYPKREGGNSRKDALKAWRARVREGVPVHDMLEGVRRYAAFCTATGKVGTQFVMQASRFFGTSEQYAEAWTVPGAQGAAQQPAGDDYWRACGYQSWIEAQNDNCTPKNAWMFEGGKKVRTVQDWPEYKARQASAGDRA